MAGAEKLSRCPSKCSKNSANINGANVESSQFFKNCNAKRKCFKQMYKSFRYVDDISASNEEVIYFGGSLLR